ncbi:MAG: hypothetical protein J0I49_11765 [Pseudonocardia sp.]|uniref:hypothetical protein n=1 Tax=Pseudonocardia sp. TaxID=60912 RepID=UPI001AC3CC94|nr:hypothetical protein [Pseudonocardia sp.]MBN9098771.1 hypothetical protein [Pseudonocardia sp.]
MPRFEAGVFEAGVFEAGVFEAGVFEAGVFEAGVFEVMGIIPFTRPGLRRCVRCRGLGAVGHEHGGAT